MRVPHAAHAARIASDPAENAALTESPPRVSATFNEAMQAEFAAMTVVGPDGNLWSDRRAGGQGRRHQRRGASPRPGGHVHRELPGDIGRRPRRVGFVVVPADRGGHRHLRSASRRLAAPTDASGNPRTRRHSGLALLRRRRADRRRRCLVGGAAPEVKRRCGAGRRGAGGGGRVGGGVGAGVPAGLADRDAGARGRRLRGGHHASGWRPCRCSTTSGTAANSSGAPPRRCPSPVPYGWWPS